MRKSSSSPASSRPGSRESSNAPQKSPSPPPDAAALAAKFPWAAQFAGNLVEKDLGQPLRVALWGDSEKGDGSKKEHLHQLFNEINKLSGEQDVSTGPPTEGGDTASSFGVRQGSKLEDAGVGELTEDWGGAVAFADSVQFGNSRTLASEDILAAALH